MEAMCYGSATAAVLQPHFKPFQQPGFGIQCLSI